jgi:FlaA1/EpsC-like NDP-sugar epimerase
VRDLEQLRQLFRDGRFDAVIHFAAKKCACLLPVPGMMHSRLMAQ